MARRQLWQRRASQCSQCRQANAAIWRPLAGLRGHLATIWVCCEDMRADAALRMQGDVRKADDTARCIQQTLERFQRLDILVNCAAGNFLVSAAAACILSCPWALGSCRGLQAAACTLTQLSSCYAELRATDKVVRSGWNQLLARAGRSSGPDAQWLPHCDGDRRAGHLRSQPRSLPRAQQEPCWLHY